MTETICSLSRTKQGKFKKNGLRKDVMETLKFEVRGNIHDNPELLEESK